MIHRIYSDLSSFKTLEFHCGMNVLLARRSKGSSDSQTRNRTGKSSLVKVINFLSGASCRTDSMFRTQALNDWPFCMEFDIAGSRQIVCRSGATQTKLVLQEGRFRRWPVSPQFDERSDSYLLSVYGWRAVLGKLIFDLPVSDDGRSVEPYGPTFRMVFPYFAREEEDGGFQSPTKQFSKQPIDQEQVAISFLLDLDWSISARLEGIRQKEKSLKTIRKEAKTGMLGEVVRPLAELQTKLTLSEDRCLRLRTNLQRFNVLPQYRDLEREASDLTRRINLLGNENALDRQRLAQIQETHTREIPPSIDKLTGLYEEAKIILPELVKKRFEQVEAFHESILTNRRAYLLGEIEEARERIASRDNEMSMIEDRRSIVMSLLNSHGALDQYQQFQRELTRCEVELQTIRKQFEAARLLEQQTDALEDARRSLKRLLRQDFDERNEALKRAILYFQEVSSSLYGPESGSLTFEVSENGPKFNVRIHGKGSKGITRMQVFCFDMMVMRLCFERGIGPGLLVHDSHIFDGVDERQIASALEYGAAAAEKYKFQYIVTMNEDVVPCDLFTKRFWFGDYVLPTVLTDDEDGGLFGIRF